MPVEAAAAAGSFIVLFVAWVVIPSHLRKRHAAKTEDETPKQSV